MRAMSTSLRILAVFCALLAASASAAAGPAEALAARLPAGSIAGATDVERARAEAGAAETAARSAWQAEEARCAGSFFVNACRDRARRALHDAQREIRRVRLEADQVERRLQEVAEEDEPGVARQRHHLLGRRRRRRAGEGRGERRQRRHPLPFRQPEGPARRKRREMTPSVGRARWPR